MLKFKFKNFNKIARCINHLKRKYSTDIRNIGILAHIDAGKTTTTERMLFYSGKTRTLGEVHRGNTVTDYLAQERERGITICSSAVTFFWNKHKINLLDTPGHIDFTMEVEQSLFAVDGVIVILDGSAGVEAQTLTVWSQADRHQLPRMIFVNKMDRPDSDFEACLDDIQNKLDSIPLCMQWPLKNNGNLLGLVDLINLKKIIWKSSVLGREYEILPLDDEILGEMQERRKNLIDQISGMNDELAEIIIASESFEKIPIELIYKAIREATCKKNIVPVFLGSAYKNIGVQPVMDAVIKFLPASNERNLVYNYFGNDFVGKVFKIVHDKQRGPLTLVRVFNGVLKKGMRLTVANGSTEVLQKLYEPLADEYREVNSIGAGDVGVCGGLKQTVTGDLLTSSASSLKNAQDKLRKSLGLKDETDSNLVNEMLSVQPHIPDAVYFCSIEPPSLSYQNALEIALRQLQREDPSLRVSYNETTGQTVLGGMGELHIEVVKSRILTEYKIDADLGPLQIAYREMIDTEMEDTLDIQKEIAGSKQQVKMCIKLLIYDGKEKFFLDKSPENSPNLTALRPKQLQLIKKGALSALERGPRVGGQVVDTAVKLNNVIIGRGTADSFLMAATAQCVQKILIKVGTRLLEPVMSIQIVSPSEKVSLILGDLAKRRAIINDVRPKGEKNKFIEAVAPLSELTGYSTALRTISSGTASITMQPYGYTKMNPQEEIVAIKRAQGLE